MEDRKTIFDYLAQVIMIFGITTLILVVLCCLCGDEAGEISSIFRLGKQGLSCVTLLQFFGASVVITGIRYVFFTEKIIKRMTLAWRTVCMVVTVICAIAVFVYFCGWFPVRQWLPWCMFLGSFFVCFVLSLGVSVLKEKAENQALEKALKKLQEQDNKNF